MNEIKCIYDSSDKIKLCGLLSKVNDNDKIIVMCHGLHGNKSENGAFDKLTAVLSKNNINSFRFDFRAHGESIGNDFELTISGEINDLKSTIKYLESKGYKSFILLGASFGAGTVGLLDYSKYKSIKGIIFWYGALDYKHPSNKAFTNEGYEIAKKEQFYTRIKKDGKKFKYCLKLFEEINSFKPYKNISNVNVPILFIHGKEDQTIPYELSKNISNMCKDFTLILIENGNHTFSSSTKALNEAVNKTLDFIKKIF